MSELIPCLCGEDLLRSEEIKHYPILIKSLISCPIEIYNDLYLTTLHKLAEYCQAMVFSSTEFNQSFGYLERQLKLTTKILQLRRGRLFPKNAGAEQISSEEAAWTYALFSAGLFDDLFYLLTNREVKMVDGKDQTISIWDPLLGPLYKRAKFYEVRLIDRQPKQIDILMAALVEHIIPSSAVKWLRKNSYLFQQWWEVILQTDSFNNEIKQIIQLSKEHYRPQSERSNVSVFLTWIGSHVAHFPDDVFRVKEGLFVKQDAMEKFLLEHQSFSKALLLTELQKENLLIVANDDIYHLYAPKNYVNRNVIKGILLNIDLLPQFSLLLLNRSYNKEIFS